MIVINIRWQLLKKKKIIENLKFVEQISDENEELHRSQTLSHTLPSSNRKGSELVYFFRIPIRVNKAHGIESLRVRENLKQSGENKIYNINMKFIALKKHQQNSFVILQGRRVACRSGERLRYPQESWSLPWRHFCWPYAADWGERC